MKKSIICLLLLVGCSANSSNQQETHDKIIKDRVWLYVDKNYDGHHAEAFAIIEGGSGLNAEAWIWREEQEKFLWDLNDESYDFSWPHTNSEETINIKAWECNENNFELCLTIDSKNIKSKTFNSNWDMVVGPHTSLSEKMKEQSQN